MDVLIQAFLAWLGEFSELDIGQVMFQHQLVNRGGSEPEFGYPSWVPPGDGSYFTVTGYLWLYVLRMMLGELEMLDSLGELAGDVQDTGRT